MSKKNQMNVSDLASKIFWSLLSQVFTRGSLMASAMILAKSLDTQDFAKYSYFQLTASMLAAYAAMGLGVTSSRYFSEIGHEKSNHKRFPVGMLWVSSIVLSGLVFLIILIIPGRWLSAGLPIENWLIACGVLSLSLGIVPSGAILGLEKYKQASSISIVCGVLTLVGACIAALNKNYIYAISAISISALVQSLGEGYIVIRLIGWQKLAFSKDEIADGLRRIAAFAGPMLIVSLMAASGPWILGRMIIANHGGSQAFATYAIGLQWFAFVLVIPGMVSRVMLPRVVRLSNKNDIEQKRLIYQGIGIAGISAAGAALLGVAFVPKIIEFYGDQYAKDQWFLVGYMVAAVLSAPANTLGNAIIAKNGQMQWLLLTAIWLGVLVISGFFVISNNYGSGSLVLSIAAVMQTAMAVAIAKYHKLI